MKKSIIDEICFNGESLIEQVVLSEEYKNLSADAHKYYNQVNEVLTDEQRNVFDKFVNSEFETSAVGQKMFFKEGFKAGVLLAMECLK